MKSRTNGETFRVGMVLLKAVEDKTNKCQGCYFYHICKAINESGYEEKDSALDMLKTMTGECNNVKFIKLHERPKTIVKRKIKGNKNADRSNQKSIS